MKKEILSILTAVSIIPSVAFAQAADEIVVDSDSSTNLSISVYNDNLAFIKDVRKVNLKQGSNAVAFVGVASQMRPETAIVNADGIMVMEQNYDFNVITPQSILKESVGNKVKTAITNSETGKTTFSEAMVVEGQYGVILQFDYGIETNFPGRVIFNELPKNLRKKPTFVVSLYNDSITSKNIELNYLTRGMAWKADYIANVKDGSNLVLESFVTLTNNSGVDYKDAKIHLVSGNINQVYGNAVPLARSMMMGASKEMMMDAAVDESSAGGFVGQGSVADYHIYTIPNTTTIRNQQTKQLKLFQSDSVEYKKEYKFVSPLNINLYATVSEFKRANPTTIYKITNNETINAGAPLPKGVIRFYQKDDNANSQFIGESEIKSLAVGEESELSLGTASEIFARGRIANSATIAADIKEFDIEITFNNSKSEEVKIIFEQNIYDDWSIISESHESERRTQNVAKWEISIPAKGEVVLKFKVRVSRQR